MRSTTVHAKTHSYKNPIRPRRGFAAPRQPFRRSGNPEQHPWARAPQARLLGLHRAKSGGLRAKASEAKPSSASVDRDGHVLEQYFVHLRLFLLDATEHESRPRHRFEEARLDLRGRLELDELLLERTSTRLNSSHVRTSYA